MKITYDQSADAAYVYFGDPDQKILHTYPCQLDAGMINIDFDENGRIFGIECIPGSVFLNEEMLLGANRL